TSGIGRSTAISLSKVGWNVVITARREAALEETRSLCANPDGGCLVVPGELTDEEFVIGLFDKATERFGRLDLLFNNAGMVSRAAPIEDLTLSDFQRVIDVNLTAPFLCTRQAFRVFKAQTPQGGRIINNGSISAQIPRPNSFPYTASKHAINGLTKCTALDGRAYDITCTQIDIGGTNTQMGAPLANGALQPDGRIVQEPIIDVQYIADAVVHVASLPLEVMVLDLTILPTKAPFVGRG
ncbi:short-chain dehydrogenase/reductase SDR, partial [Pluteus cervinus]